MTKADLMKLVGKKVFVYFKGGEKGIYGVLGYVDEFSAKHDYRKPDYFYIGNTSFKVSHIRKVAESEDVVHNHFMCQDCGFIHDFVDGHTAQYKYCPNCGAKMQEVE